jgi:hypothetical protein
MAKSFEQISRDEWNPADGQITQEAISTGSLQRIAHALEKVAAELQRIDVRLESLTSQLRTIRLRKNPGPRPKARAAT